MTEPADVPLRRRPKGDKRDRTRAALLEAARDLVREKGYERITLEEVATRAGMTTGAIYGNFKNRDELFVALGLMYWAPIQPRVSDDATFADVMRAIAEATLAVIPERAAAAGGRMRGIAFTLGNPALQSRVHAVTAESLGFGEEWLQSVCDPRELPMPADRLIRVIHALSEGLVMQRLLTPDLYPDEVFYAAFAALATRSPDQPSSI